MSGQRRGWDGKAGSFGASRPQAYITPSSRCACSCAWATPLVRPNPSLKGDPLRQPPLGRSRHWCKLSFRGQAASASTAALARTLGRAKSALSQRRASIRAFFRYRSPHEPNRYGTRRLLLLGLGWRLRLGLSASSREDQGYRVEALDRCRACSMRRLSFFRLYGLRC